LNKLLYVGLKPVTFILKPISSGYRRPSMSRNFYILAAALAFFAMLSGAMTLVPSSFQPGLPANGSLWRMVALVMLLAALGCALIAVFSHLFEQVDRRSEAERVDARRRRRELEKPPADTDHGV
jgi:hypothetical protein